jgi:hypothetical protein
MAHGARVADNETDLILKIFLRVLLRRKTVGDGRAGSEKVAFLSHRFPPLIL